jgi:hypothetical protein
VQRDNAAAVFCHPPLRACPTRNAAPKYKDETEKQSMRSAPGKETKPAER